MNHPHTKRAMTNTEFLSHMMERAKAGPIMQIMIVSAIDNYTKACLERGEGCLGGATAMINEAAWLAACKEFQEALEERAKPENEFFIEELDTDHLDDDEFYVRLLNDHLQSLRSAALNTLNFLERLGSSAVSERAMLRHGLQVTGGAFVDELVRD